MRKPRVMVGDAARVEIVRRAEAGEKYAAIARDFNIAEITASLICRRAGIYRRPRQNMPEETQ